jgi:rod shape determining protein RodA
MQQWYRKLDFLTLFAWAGVVAVGLVAIYSTTHGPAAEYLPESVQQNFQRQFMWSLVCLCFVIGTLFFPIRFFQRIAYPVYALVIGLLGLTLAIGESVGGAKSWIDLGFAQIQAAEIAKPGTVLGVAALLTSRRPDSNNVRYAVGAVVMLLIPAVLILMQNDTGTALVFLGLIPIMLFWSGLPIPTMLLMVAPAIVGYFVIYELTWIAVILGIIITGYIFWRTGERYMGILAGLATGGTILVTAVALTSVLAPHQVARIKSFTNPDAPQYRKGVGFNLVQSKAAIGSGGMTGKGFMEGTQTQGAYVPEQSTDFIFSVIGEEFGFVGSVVVLALFGLLLVRIVQLGAQVKHPFANMMAAGAVGVYTIHIFINLGMVTGLLPVIGIPLPFVSYGGSALLANTSMLAVVLDLHMRRDDFSIYGY